MEFSLDEYIEHKPTLKAAITGAKMRSKHERRIHNSDEFKAESRQYVCTEEDVDNDDPQDNINELLNAPVFEEAYLSLDLNEEDEFDKMYERLNNNLTKQAADSTQRKMANAPKNQQAAKTFSSDEKVNTLLKQGGFDLRDVVNNRNQAPSQQWRLKEPNLGMQRPAGLPSLVPKQYINHNKNGNREARKNFPYKKNRGGVGNNNLNRFKKPNQAANGASNGNQVWQSQNPCSSIPGNGANLGFGMNDSYHHHSGCRGCGCNSSRFCTNRNQAALLSPGCSSFGLNGASALNTSLGCTHTGYGCGHNNGLNTNTMLNELLNTAAGCVSDLNANRQEGMVLSMIAKNLLNNLVQPNRQEQLRNSQNTSFFGLSNERPTSFAATNFETRSNGNTASSMQGKSLQSVLGINQGDLDSGLTPVMMTQLAQFLQNGLTIKLMPSIGNEQNASSPENTAENMQL